MVLELAFLFTTASTDFNLPPGLLESLCFVESTHRVNAVHHDDGGSDSLGICQVKLETARMLGFKGTRAQLMIPKNNIRIAAKMLAHQYKRYGSIERAIVAYNKGNARGLTTSKYSIKVITQWRGKSVLPYAYAVCL